MIDSSLTTGIQAIMPAALKEEVCYLTKVAFLNGTHFCVGGQSVLVISLQA